MKGEARRERTLQISTSGFIHSGSKKNFHYQPASYKVLDKIFRTISRYNHTHRFIDIGCGMGRVMAVAASYGFRDIEGIELDPNLLDIARANMKSFVKTQTREHNFRFTNSNAAEVTYKSSKAVYFFFNPFDENVLKKVLDNIIQVAVAGTVFVYMNPRHRAPFKTKNFSIFKEIRTSFYIEAVIYKLHK